MKKTATYFMMVLIALPVWGQENQNQNNNNQQGQNNQSLPRECIPQKRDANNQVALSSCEELMIISRLNKQKSYDDDVENVRTFDGKVTCVGKGGFTFDYDDCKRVRNLYNSVIIAEKAMFAQQAIRINENNIQQSEDVAKATQQGDAQNAALDASRKRNEQNSEMFKEQAVTYSLAVTAMTGGLSSWQGKGEKSLGKVCAKTENLSAAKSFGQDKLGFSGFKSAEDCKKLLTSRKGSLFSNNDARTQFWMLNGELVTKAAAAASKAGVSEQIAQLQKNAPQVNDEENLMLDPCVVNPSQQECQQNGPRIPPAGTMQAATVDLGPGAGNQSFDFNSEAAAGPNLGGPTATGTSKDKVADVASPFEAEAKAANGILNPSAEASISGSSQASAPGGGAGGGGGGGGGGGSGDPAAKDDPNKEPEINVTKVSGKYSSGGGDGFKSIKGSKEEANPFSSLFDSKSPAGGIEEDRTIAGDIDGAASGLFQKISKKYGQAQQDKRIESQNLE